MLGKRETYAVPEGGKEDGSLVEIELDRIYQLYLKRRPWTPNFKVFVEKLLGITVRQDVVQVKDDSVPLVRDPRWLELLEIFNKKQARLASEVVGEEIAQNDTSSKLDLTNASTTLDDSRTEFQITPDKLHESASLGQYAAGLFEVTASLPSVLQQPDEGVHEPEQRRNEPDSGTTMQEEFSQDKGPEQPQGSHLQQMEEERAEEDHLGAAESEDAGYSQEHAAQEALDALQHAHLFSESQHAEEPFVTEGRSSLFKRTDSFDLLTDTDLEGFTFEKEDYRKLTVNPVDKVKNQLGREGFSQLYL